MKQKRAKWGPTSSSCVCSEHIKALDFSRKFTTLPGQEKYVPWLETDELGIIPFSLVFKKKDHEEELWKSF